MMTPMDKTLEFLKQMEEQFAQIQKEHWAWFYDESGNALSPRVHYRQLDEQILCLADCLAHKAKQIQEERARDEAAEKLHRLVREEVCPLCGEEYAYVGCAQDRVCACTERQDEVDFCESEFGED